MYVKVTICAPGSVTNCQTVDHVQVDTGSQGLRIISSALNPSLLSALPAETVNGQSLAECLKFVDSYSWGTLVNADAHIGGSDTATSGESAPDIPVQIIGTSTYSVPSDCSSSGGAAQNTVLEFGANGIIGVGLFDYDCGTGCTTQAANESNGLYYTCTSAASCVLTPVPEASQNRKPRVQAGGQQRRH